MTGTHATYGQVMEAARRAAQHGMGTLAKDPLPDTAAAQAALTARARLLAAVGHHAATLIGSPRLAAWREPAPHRHTPDPRTPATRATLAWIDALQRQGLAPPPPDPLTSPDAFPSRAGEHGAGPADAWARAHALVGRATDLVATHLDPAGAVRPGTPATLALADTGALLADAMRLVAVIAPTEPLALRCRQAGMTRSQLDARLPVGDRLLEDTWALARLLRFPATAVSGLTVARPGIDAVDPADEWAQRIARVHARTHRHAQRGHASVRTLRDLARLGLVTSHVLATSGRRDHARQGAVTDRWRGVLAHLEPLRSTEPADRVLRHDVDRLLQLAHPDHGEHPAERARLLDAIEASVPTLNACSGLAERLLAGSADAWIPAPPRRAYLPDLARPGRAARRAPPLAAPWPRTDPARQTGSGLAPP